MTSLLPHHRVLERVTLTSPLGVRFFDVATNTPVRDGLSVESFAPANPHRRVMAVRTPGGAYAFHDLPGLREFEHNSADERRWSPPPPARPFVVEVRDETGRFLPCRFTAHAPHRGPFELPPGASPPVFPAGTVPLFSAPTRTVPDGFAVLRAQLLAEDGDRHVPAAWALAEVSIRMTHRWITRRGLADQQGQLAVIFPWPEPANLAVASPPGSPPQLMGKQSWPVQFCAWHAVDSPPNAPAETAGERLADLDRVLALLIQPHANLSDDVSPPVPFTQAELTFGRELLVPERGPGDARPRTLLITH